MSATTITTPADLLDQATPDTDDETTDQALDVQPDEATTTPEPTSDPEAPAEPDTGDEPQAADDPDTSTTAGTGYLVHLAPTALAFEDNIRTEADLDDPFVESVRDHGVLLPVRAFLADDGQVTVRDGKRRVLAAIKTERATVPVYVTDPGDGTTQRVTQQYDTNERRSGLSDADRIGAWKQLQLEGMSPTAIAKVTHEKRTTVQAGLKVAASDTATAAVVEHDLTLDQAVALIEFEDDPHAAKALRDTARRNPDGFAHHAQRLRDQRKTDRQIADLTAEFAERGVQVIAWPRSDDKDTLRLADLTEADGTDLGPETFATRPGYRVAIREAWNGVQVGHFVADWRSHGLKKRRAGGGAATGWTEQQRRERRELIANNKAWPSAETVRRRWLTTFLARKTTPKDALAFVAAVAVAHPDRIATALSTHQEVAATLVGGTYEWGKKHPLAALLDANPAKATTVLLAVTLGALEQATSKNTWRHPGTADVAYFTAIKTWGYVLSDVENLVLGIKPEPADDDTAKAEPGEADQEFGPDDDEAYDESDDDWSQDDDTDE